MKTPETFEWLMKISLHFYFFHPSLFLPMDELIGLCSLIKRSKPANFEYHTLHSNNRLAFFPTLISVSLICEFAERAGFPASHSKGFRVPLTMSMFPVRVVVESVRPQHCLTCARDGHMLVDSYAIVSGATLLSQLVDTVLSALGMPQLAVNSKGSSFHIHFISHFNLSCNV